jgi:hypothetical protein
VVVSLWCCHGSYLLILLQVDVFCNNLMWLEMALTPQCCIAIIDVLCNRSSRLEMVKYMLSIFAANCGCRCYRVGGPRGAKTH